MNRSIHSIAPLLMVVALAACQRDAEPGEPATEPGVAPAPAGDAAAVTAGDPSSAELDPAMSGAINEGIVQSAFQCGEQRLSARFDNGAGTVTLVHDRGELVLMQARSASGARYADDNGNEFWNKGNEATLTQSGQEPVQCQQVPGAAG